MKVSEANGGEPAPLNSFSQYTVLVRSSWQTVNIGDIGHSPGVISLLEKHLPGVKIILWPDLLDRGVREMMLRRFPDLVIADGTIGEDGRPTTDALSQAMDEADFLMHGSGPYVVALPHVEAWTRLTGKPYGIYGVTIDPISVDGPDGVTPPRGYRLDEQRRMIEALPADGLSPSLRDVLERASFVMCRDTLTMEYLRRQNLNSPCLRFTPDGAFGIDLRDEQAADAFLGSHGLVPREFVCIIPRLRFTPYHLTHGVPAKPRDEARLAVSSLHVEEDMAKLREMIIGWVRATGLKVLLCPEMTYQVDLCAELCGEKLPEDVRANVVWRRTYWLPDEACSTYARALAVVSLDNHTPIFALTVGVPTIFLRHPTDTIKGQIWNDLGLGEWFFEIEDATGSAVLDLLLNIKANPAAARDRVDRIMAAVHEFQSRNLSVLSDLLTHQHFIERVQ